VTEPLVDSKLRELVEPEWEHQPGEGVVAYASFRAFRDLGPSRTLTRAADMLTNQWADIPARTGRVKTQKSYASRVFHLSARNRWVERAAAYDAYVDHFVMEERELASRSTAKLLEARAQRVREMEWEIGESAYRGLIQYLQNPPLGSIVTKDGVTVHVHPNPAYGKVLPGIMREGSRIIRLATGMPTEGSRMPTVATDTSATSDVEMFLKSLGQGSEETSPSALLPDSTDEK